MILTNIGRKLFKKVRRKL